MDHNNVTSGKVTTLSIKTRRTKLTPAPSPKAIKPVAISTKKVRIVQPSTINTTTREKSPVTPSSVDNLVIGGASRDNLATRDKRAEDNLLALLLYRALADDSNNDWNGTGTTFAGALVQILMGSKGTNGALSAYLLNTWLTHGAGADTINRAVDKAIGSRLPAKSDTTAQEETPTPK